MYLHDKQLGFVFQHDSAFKQICSSGALTALHHQSAKALNTKTPSPSSSEKKLWNPFKKTQLEKSTSLNVILRWTAKSLRTQIPFDKQVLFLAVSCILPTVIKLLPMRPEQKMTFLTISVLNSMFKYRLCPTKWCPLRGGYTKGLFGQVDAGLQWLTFNLFGRRNAGLRRLKFQLTGLRE